MALSSSSGATFFIMENESKPKPQPHHLLSRPPLPRPPQIPGTTLEGRMVMRQKSLGLWVVQRTAAYATVVHRTLEAISENPDVLPGIKESDEQAKSRSDYGASVKPAHFVMKLGFKSTLEVVRHMLMGLFLWLLCMSSAVRSLMLRFPRFFSLGWFRRTIPTKEVKSATFKIWFVGRGYCGAGKGSGGPDTAVVTRASGPEASYMAIIILQCVLTALSQRRNLPRETPKESTVVYKVGEYMQEIMKSWKEFGASQDGKIDEICQKYTIWESGPNTYRLCYFQ